MKHEDVIGNRIEHLTRKIQHLKTIPFYKFFNEVLDLKIPSHTNKLKEKENYIFGAGTDGRKLQVHLGKISIDFKRFIDLDNTYSFKWHSQISC